MVQVDAGVDERDDATRVRKVYRRRVQWVISNQSPGVMCLGRHDPVLSMRKLLRRREQGFRNQHRLNLLEPATLTERPPTSTDMDPNTSNMTARFL